MDLNFVFFLPNSRGGVATFINNYTRVIKGCRIKVIRYRTSDAFISKTEVTRDAAVEQISVGFSKYSPEKSKFRILHGLIAENDVLICNDSLELEFINWYGLKNKIVYILHGDLVHYHNILKEYNSSIDLVLCVSSGLKRKYELLFPGLEFRVSHPLLLEFPDKSPASGEVLNCIFIGKFEHQKGADLFLDLATSFSQKVNWTVVAISDGSDSELMSQIPSYVKIVKDLPNEKLLEVLNATDVLVFPSRTEGFGIAILEAMSRAVIPIVLDIPIGIPDQVLHEYNGFIIEEENWKTAESHLAKLCSDRDLLITMKKNAFKFVRENYDPEVIASEFVAQVSKAVTKSNKNFSKIQIRYLDYLPEVIYKVIKYLYYRGKTMNVVSGFSK